MATTTGSARLTSSTGLTSEEARRRLEQDGPNVLRAAPPVPRWRAFLAELEAGPWSPALAAAACHGAQAAFDCLLKRIDAEAEVALP